ncbi:hypothetical protein KRR26_04375 [Corallococcus sp. M34]|uniref:hypothetical protein n=1 Tax=Citreicoccus inhibens TaxID=2849499 RepID=UPI0011C39157|nr:hypothetical protein [Citreicoccus inhibens]MBU8894823.1 hypothetical protein [Citreicoccus inhibens]
MRSSGWILLVAVAVGMTGAACTRQGSIADATGGSRGARQTTAQTLPWEELLAPGRGGAAELEFLGTVTATGGSGFSAEDIDGVERPFVVGPSTRFLLDGHPVQLSQLQPGAQVHTLYDEEQGEWLAEEVEIYPGTPATDHPTAGASQ